MLPLLAALAALSALAAPPPAGPLPRLTGAPPVAPAGDSAEPRSLEGLRRLARAHARARRFPEAIRTYERILAVAPGDADAQIGLAQLLAWSGDYDRAIVLYRDAIARRPRDLGLRSDLADVLTWAKRYEEAERLYEEVLSAYPDHHEALKGLGRARLLHGDAEGAGTALDRALQLYPQDVDLLRDKARLLTERNDLDGAVALLQRAARIAPGDPEVRRHLGDVFLRQGDHPRAVEAFLRWAQLEPNAPGAHVALGRAYLAQGRLPLAREHVGMALRLNPADAAATTLAQELAREAGLAPARSASELLELGAYLFLVIVTVVAARRTRRYLQRRRTAWIFAQYVVPGFLLLNVASHLLKNFAWRWVDARLLEAATEVVLFLGLGAAFVAVLRAEGTAREFTGQVALAIGAHPDDIELGTAGFLLKLKASGARIYGMTLTKGERGDDQEGQREQEARRSAAFLGFDGYWILDFPDTGLAERIPGLKAVIESKIRELGATVVLTHTDVDVHGDHRAVHAATREAARTVPTVLCYEDVSTSAQFTPNFYADISGYLDDHLRAVAFHRTQGHRSYMDPEVLKGRAAHRGMQVGSSFALAFRTINMVR